VNADELEMLTEFRAGVPYPDEDTTARAFAIATTDRASGRRPRSRRRRLGFGLILAVLLCVPAAVALGERFTGFLAGTPAPPAVSDSFRTLNRMAGYSTQKGFAARVPRAVANKAHGVIEVATADGPEDLWVAPSNQGGTCWFIDFADDPPGLTGQRGFGGCEPPNPEAKIRWGEVWTVLHPALTTVFGHVYTDAATLHVEHLDGRVSVIPVVDDMFLESIDRGASVASLTAYDASGRVVAKLIVEPQRTDKAMDR